MIPVLTDSQGKVLIGYDTINDRAIAAGIDGNVTEVSGGTTFPVKKFTVKPLVTAINHMLFYGQSLSVGAQGTPVLSTSQPYLNTTFEYGPRMDQDSTKVVPLVERVGSPASDGGANRDKNLLQQLVDGTDMHCYRLAGALGEDYAYFRQYGNHSEW
ncbi:cellulosome protein [Acinetobacter phage AIIMS-AbE5-RC]|uniref:Cellulosome protein n=1 Tax=Acinetobacter phage AIIMS-AbE5-RC TaxID=2981552 RepID=A0A9X9JPQ3_9CAUD|nr:cellulosome protein [Acinetobacter phage AIIMS-AbE5-RC]